MTPAEYAALQERAHKRLVDALETRSPDSVNAADFAAAALLIVHELSEIKDEMKARGGQVTTQLQPLTMTVNMPRPDLPNCTHPGTEMRTDGNYCTSCGVRVR